MKSVPQNTQPTFSPRLAFIILILINLCWGGSYAAIKFAMDVVPPTTLAFLRFLIGGFFLLLLPTNNKHPLGKKDWKDLFVIGAFGVAIAYAVLNLGLQMTSSTKTAIAASLEPIFTILLAAIILKEPLRNRTVIAMAVSIVGAGVLLVGGKSISQLYLELSGSGELLGDILVIFAILLCALYSILMKPVTNKLGAIRSTSYGFFIGAAILLPIVALELSQLWPLEFDRNALLSVIFLGVICNALAFGLWNLILKSTDAGAMAVTLNAQPVGGIIIGWAFMGETLTHYGIVGTLLILFGIYLLPKEAFK